MIEKRVHLQQQQKQLRKISWKVCAGPKVKKIEDTPLRSTKDDLLLGRKIYIEKMSIPHKLSINVRPFSVYYQ